MKSGPSPPPDRPHALGPLGPASAGAAPTGSPLQDLLPYLLDRARQLGEELVRVDSGTWHELQREGRMIGWMIGVLGSSRGDELLLERREADGLRWVFRFVGQALARRGIRLEGDLEALPGLQPGADSGWEVAHLWSAWLLGAAAPQGEGDRLLWSVERSGSELLLWVSPGREALGPRDWRGELRPGLPLAYCGNSDHRALRLPGRLFDLEAPPA